MSRIITKGATDQTIYFEVLDSTSTTGGRKTGLAYNTSSLTAYYVRNGGSATAITLATLAAANSAHSDGGFKEVDSTNMPGIYRLDLPDAAVASGADSVVVTIKGATGMAQVSAEIQLVAVNPQDAVRGGMTALPNAAADAAGGLIISDAGGLDADAQRSDVTTILADTNDIQSRLPAALVSGRMDASVGAMAANVMTAAAAASDLTTEIQSGLATAADLATVAGYVDTEVAAIKAQTDKLTFDGANHIVADARKISTSSTAADNLEAGALAVVVSTCAAGSTTTAVNTNLTEATDDHYNGRVIIFTSGALAGQASDITDYNGTTKALTVTALTEAPASSDAFVIV